MDYGRLKLLSSGAALPPAPTARAARKRPRPRLRLLRDAKAPQPEVSERPSALLLLTIADVEASYTEVERVRAFFRGR